MKNPFVYGKVVDGRNFCNRKREISELCRDIENSQNVIVFSQRRFGKTSLIKDVLRKSLNRGIVTVYVDLYPVVTEEDFIRIYAEAIATSIFGRARRKLKELATVFTKLRPTLTLDHGGQPSYGFDIDRREMLPSLNDVLESPKRYVLKKKQKAAVVFDEFQQIGQLGNDRIEKTIRSVTQSHNDIAYIYMGSKKHLIVDMFNNPNRPFYRSAKSFPLEKIHSGELSRFIRGKFEGSHRSLSDALASDIIRTCESHPYYVQYLCHIIWERTRSRKNITVDDMTASLKLLLQRESSAYEATMDLLTTRQKQALLTLGKSLAGDKLFSSGFLQRNNLGSASSLQRTLQSLVDKNLVDKEKNTYSIIDIFFKRWLSEL